MKSIIRTLKFELYSWSQKYAILLSFDKTEILPLSSFAATSHSPEESLAGEAAVAAVVDMAHRAVAAYPTQNLGYVCIILARAAGARATGGHLSLLTRLCS